jgi:transcriptional regulator with XRE-family HTH domain
VQNKQDDILNKRLGANIRKYRLKGDLSQAQLAFEVGCTLRQIQRLEAGESKGSIILYIRISESLSLDMNTLCAF